MSQDDPTPEAPEEDAPAPPPAVSAKEWVAGRRKYNRVLLALLIFLVFLIYYVTIARQGGLQ